MEIITIDYSVNNGDLRAFKAHVSSQLEVIFITKHGLTIGTLLGGTDFIDPSGYIINILERVNLCLIITARVFRMSETCHIF